MKFYKKSLLTTLLAAVVSTSCAISGGVDPAVDHHETNAAAQDKSRGNSLAQIGHSRVAYQSQLETASLIQAWVVHNGGEVAISTRDVWIDGRTVLAFDSMKIDVPDRTYKGDNGLMPQVIPSLAKLEAAIPSGLSFILEGEEGACLDMAHHLEGSFKYRVINRCDPPAPDGNRTAVSLVVSTNKSAINRY